MPANTNRLDSSEQLKQHQALVSADGRFEVAINDDGIRLFRFELSQARETFRLLHSLGSDKFIDMDFGFLNLKGTVNHKVKVLHKRPLTSNHNLRAKTPQLVVQDDGNLVLYDISGTRRAVWASQTHGNHTRALNKRHPTVVALPGTLAIEADRIFINETDTIVNFNDGLVNKIVGPNQTLGVRQPIGGPLTLAIQINDYDTTIAGTGKNSADVIEQTKTFQSSGREIRMVPVSGGGLRLVGGSDSDVDVCEFHNGLLHSSNHCDIDSDNDLLPNDERRILGPNFD